MNSTEAMPGQVAQLVREHVVEQVDDAIHGVTFDGRRLVLAAGYRLFRLIPDSCRLVDELETFPARGGLAYDGRHLWQHSEGHIEQLDPRTGLVVKAIAPELEDLTGLECVGPDLLLLHAGGRRLARVETLDAKPVADVEVGPRLRGLGWVGGLLWSAAPDQLCRLDPVTGRIVARFALPPQVEVSDLAGDAEGHVWCVDGGSRLVRAFVR